MLARDIMTRDVITVSSATTVKNLAKILIQNQISGAPVVDKKGKILGVVSEADIVAKKGKQVKEIMSKTIVGVTDDTPVEEIAAIMTTHKIKRVPVMRGKKLAGIVSPSGIVGGGGPG